MLLAVVINAEIVDKPCTSWFYHNNNSTECECGSNLEGVVICNGMTRQLGILNCYCMTTNGVSSNETVVGKCLFNCGNETHPLLNGVKNHVYHTVSTDVIDLDERSCGYLNRKGRLCSKCKDNFSFPVYSYDFHCIHCPETSWIKYFAVAFVPLTGFYFLILIFSVSTPSPKLKSFCFCAQFIGSSPNVRIFLQSLYNYPTVSLLAKVIFTMYGFWNLDFFRTLLPPNCLQLSTLQILTLDYIIAVYPLLLIALTSLLITLYDRDYPLIIKLWKPFQRFFILFKRQWNLNTCIIGAFATFTLLSYDKLLSVSFDLLIFTKTYNMKGEMVGVYLYYDSSVEYMGKEHLPFACMALIILSITLLFPLTLLIFYPMMWFQRFLNCCHLNSEKLRVFIECFQGYYQNRAEEGREYRYMAALFFVSRPLLFIIVAATLSSLSYVLCFLIFTLFGTIFFICQPYKKRFSVYNKVEGSMLLLLALINGGVTLINLSNIMNDHQFTTVAIGIIIVTSIFPLVYISVLTLHWFYFRRLIIIQIFRKVVDNPLLNYGS